MNHLLHDTQRITTTVMILIMPYIREQPKSAMKWITIVMVKLMNDLLIPIMKIVMETDKVIQQLAQEHVMSPMDTSQIHLIVTIQMHVFILALSGI